MTSNLASESKYDDVKKILIRQGYKIIGKHSAVKQCLWLKRSMTEGNPCYKEKFYGISSHRCVQMTPSFAWCQHSCLFCWRPVEHSLGTAMNVEPDEPDFIVEESIKAQKRILTGYGGDKRVSREKFIEANSPKHAAISLAGEPTTYPYIQELIEAYHRRGFTTFLVTNGQNPEMLEKCSPTQLYLSLIAPNNELYRKINRPLLKDGWGNLIKSLEIFSTKKTKKVIRITLVRGYNLEHPEKFAELIEKANPDYIEPKGYVHVGYSRLRLNREDMPSYEEVIKFGEILSRETGYRIKDSSRESKVALLAKP